MTRFTTLTRKEYLKRQKEDHARSLFGVFPAQYPKEILWAMNALPVEIWDPPLEINQANAHLQPSICSVVRSGLELVLQGHCDGLDGFLFPHTCDSIQNLASIVHDFLGLGKPCYFFYHPKAPYRESARIYYREQLKGLVGELERQLGPLDPVELKRRLVQGQQLAFLVQGLYEWRAKGQLAASNSEFYRVIRQGEYLHPDDFIPLLEEFLHASRGAAPSGPAIVLSGVLPNPPEILTLLDQLGVRIAEDDLLACGRRLLVPRREAEDPFEALTESYMAMPPCSTKDSPIQDRLDSLLEKVKRSAAKGVIFNVVKFCEPELFDLPLLGEALKSRGLATLVIDSEVNQGLSGQMGTRIEAFVEMIS
ncbi:MAG: 2-hydroxyacyl-CoA dehydratase family protein [Desulfobacterales bacterium]|nr:2-hydroxyacyl-CoA dehydratase family protein [Desulfobacterales bacterium]